MYLSSSFLKITLFSCFLSSTFTNQVSSALPRHEDNDQGLKMMLCAS